MHSSLDGSAATRPAPAPLSPTARRRRAQRRLSETYQCTRGQSSAGAERVPQTDFSRGDGGVTSATAWRPRENPAAVWRSHSPRRSSGAERRAPPRSSTVAARGRGRREGWSVRRRGRRLPAFWRLPACVRVEAIGDVRRRPARSAAHVDELQATRPKEPRADTAPTVAASRATTSSSATRVAVAPPPRRPPCPTRRAPHRRPRLDDARDPVRFAQRHGIRPRVAARVAPFDTLPTRCRPSRA